MLQSELDNFKQEVQSKLEEEFEACKQNLKNILEPAIKENPPDELKYGINTSKPNKATVEKYLNTKLKSIIPKTEDFTKDMNPLSVQEWTLPSFTPLPAL